MALSLRPRQSQKQALTPAMWMGLNLLTLPIGELKESIKREVESNPALEVERPASFAGGRAAASGPAAQDYLENVAAESGESLDEHLMSELRMSGVDGRELVLCQAIVAELDRDGRFRGSVPDLQMVTGATADELEAARRKVMTIDPKGCGARDLGECYLAQLGSVPASRREQVRQAAEAIARATAEGSGTPPRLEAETIRLLKALDAFPGRQYDFRRVESVTPDIRVDEDGTVEVDRRDVPELRVSPKFVEMAKDRTLDAETRRFAAERVKKAREFREAVVRRQETMEKIAELTVGGQAGFLKKGTAGLRRQTMSEIARRAKCSVATVSRAAARKYVKTPRGTVPLRKFFALVDQAPLEKLREIISGAKGSLSDRAVAELMARAGHPMARRTVAKYRVRFGR